MNRTNQFKMVLLGESAVGKSSLALRFAKGQYLMTMLRVQSVLHF